MSQALRPDIVPAVALLTSQVFPKHAAAAASCNLGIGPVALRQAIATIAAVPADSVRLAERNTGA